MFKRFTKLERGSMETKTVYFENPGRENTEEVLRIAKKRAEELGIKTVVVASVSGDTAVRAMDVFQGLRVIVVTHVSGFREPDVQQFTEKNREIVESKGGTLLTTAHAFAGISRAVRNKFNTYVTGEIIANTLRIFGEGTKVACEIAMMAADAGLVRTDEDVISIGGTDKGVDAAIVLKPVNSHNFFNLKVREILCKPHF
ncbi:MAG: pyruvate kinase alpha/beta domain-containing protein [Dehalococcoidales bacterium]